MTKIVARLAAVLGFESKDFINGVNEAQQKSKEFKNSLKDLHKTTESLKSAFGVASAAFIGFSTHAIQAANEVQDLANANETTTGKILELRHALSVSGGDADKVGTLFTSFTNAINEAAQGNDKLRDSFKEVGISTHDLGFLSSDELRQKAIDGLAKIEDVTHRNALAMELFSKAARNVDMKNLSDVVAESAGHYKDQEEAIKAAAAAAEKMKQIFHDVETAALMASKPVIDLFNKLPTEHKVEAVTKAFQALGIAMGIAFGVSAVSGVKTLTNALRALALANPWLLAFSAAGGIASYFFGDKLFGGGGGEHSETGSQNFPLNENTGSQKRATPASSREESFRAAIIKSNLEYEKRNSLLKESIADHSKEISLLMQKHSMSADDYSIAEKKLELDNQIYKLEQDKIREMTAAQAEYDAQPAKEKNKKLLDQTLDNIKKYYLTAIPAQKELNKLTIGELEKEIALKNKYIYQDLAIQKAKEQESIEMNHSAQMQMLELESQSYKLKASDYNLLKMRIDAAQQLASIENKYADKRRDLQTEFDRTAGTAKDRELFEAKIKNLNELQNLEIMSSDAINLKKQDNFLQEVERQKSWAAGWDEAFKQYTEAAERASDRGKEAFSMVMQSMDTALRNFVETGKLNFADLTGSIIKNLIFMELKAQATSLFKMAFGAASSAIGGMFGPGVIGTGLASGGAIDSPRLVGENGPELFVPRSAGTIIPNGSWQGMAANSGGGFTNNGTYIASMSAIDTQSATQFLASNKNTIWAAYQSANRSVPITR
jgi:lambda family phage tail tape measure protein